MQHWLSFAKISYLTSNFAAIQQMNFGSNVGSMVRMNYSNSDPQMCLPELNKEVDETPRTTQICSYSVNLSLTQNPEVKKKHRL
jgi:hypothetical protein